MQYDPHKLSISPAVDVRSSQVIGWLWIISYGTRRIGLLKDVGKGNRQGFVQLFKHLSPDVTAAIFQDVKAISQAKYGLPLAEGDLTIPPSPAKLRRMQELTQRRRKQQPAPHKGRIITPDDQEWSS